MRVGVLGAGTMGGGIAQVAAEHGDEVWLYDAVAGAAERAVGRMEGFWRRAVEKGQRTENDVAAMRGRVHVAPELDALSGSAWVIEAVTENLELKRELFRQVEALVADDAVLATNTSSLAVTQIAAGTQRPGQVVGMHFFNPAPLLPLVEVVRGTLTSDEVVHLTVALAERWGKRPVVTKDTPGFIVNRVARPFYLEALRLVGEGATDVATVDRIARGAGFRMGPFELLDLVGLDVNLAVTQSVYDQFFGEPRFRPHPLQARLVAAGHLGRKSGRGFYSHE